MIRSSLLSHPSPHILGAGAIAPPADPRPAARLPLVVALPVIGGLSLGLWVLIVKAVGVLI